MKTIHELLSTQDFIPVLYTKKDGSQAAYLLTWSCAPEYTAKTAREGVPLNDDLIRAYDLTGTTYRSLKVANITIC